MLRDLWTSFGFHHHDVRIYVYTSTLSPQPASYNVVSFLSDKSIFFISAASMPGTEKVLQNLHQLDKTESKQEY